MFLERIVALTKTDLEERKRLTRTMTFEDLGSTGSGSTLLLAFLAYFMWVLTAKSRVAYTGRTPVRHSVGRRLFLIVALGSRPKTSVEGEFSRWRRTIQAEIHERLRRPDDDAKYGEATGAFFPVPAEPAAGVKE